MSGSNKLIEIAFYVSLFVIIGLAITFSILFTLYALYKKKHIRFGHEDDKLLSILKKKYRKELKENEDISSYNAEIREKAGKGYQLHSTVGNVTTYVYDDKEHEELEKNKLVTLIRKDEEKSKKRGRITKIFSIFLYAIVFAFIGFIAFYKLNNETFYFGNTTYMVIQTASMETVNSKNDYITKNNLTNQITQFSMIGLEKVEDKDVKLYDVLAFKNANNEAIVHRVVNININNNTYYFTFRGDANSGTDISETGIASDKVIGRYNGFQNYGLGVATTYFKSSAGIVAIASAFAFLCTFDYSENMIDKEYKKRFLYIANEYDKEEE